MANFESRLPAVASTADREHFAVFARAKEEEKRDQIVRAAKLHPSADGIRIGMEMSRLWTPSAAALILEAQRADAQVELRRRWLALKEQRRAGD